MAQHLEAWLLSLRERGVVQRLGVSIYSAEDLEGVNPELLDLVQLPLSLFDQRLLEDGTLARLRRWRHGDSCAQSLSAGPFAPLRYAMAQLG